MRTHTRLGAVALVSALLAVAMPFAQAGEVPLQDGTTRLSGPTRYETSVKISQSTFTAPVSAVYVATGKAYPDALAGGPVASRAGAPVLLVDPGSVPAVVRSELRRLAPEKIFVLGGTGAVSDGVVEELKGLSPSVLRLSGSNRYETAVAASQEGWDSAPTVFLASGRGFPDALGGGAAAAHKDAPLLLTDVDSLVAPTRDELTRLAPSTVYVLGGRVALNDSVVSAVKSTLPGANVVRLSGADRYETSAEIAQAIWPNGAGAMFFATGMNFPDALSGTPAAHVNGAPLLLTKQSCLSGSVFDVRYAFAPSKIALLGGASVLTSGAIDKKCGVNVYTGVGDEVVAIQKPGGSDNPALVTASHTGSSNFAVVGLDSNLDWNTLLVNEIGDYEGTTLLDAGWVDQPSRNLEITADGQWQIEVEKVSAARDLRSSTQGHGDDVLAWTGAARVADFTHVGESNFAVEAYAGNGDYVDLLVNEIGTYSGANTIPSGTRLISVIADGDWGIRLR